MPGTSGRVPQPVTGRSPPRGRRCWTTCATQPAPAARGPPGHPRPGCTRSPCANTSPHSFAGGWSAGSVAEPAGRGRPVVALRRCAVEDALLGARRLRPYARVRPRRWPATVARTERRPGGRAASSPARTGRAAGAQPRRRPPVPRPAAVVGRSCSCSTCWGSRRSGPPTAPPRSGSPAAPCSRPLTVTRPSSAPCTSGSSGARSRRTASMPRAAPWCRSPSRARAGWSSPRRTSSHRGADRPRRRRSGRSAVAARGSAASARLPVCGTVGE